MGRMTYTLKLKKLVPLLTSYFGDRRQVQAEHAQPLRVKKKKIQTEISKVSVPQMIEILILFGFNKFSIILMVLVKI